MGWRVTNNTIRTDDDEARLRQMFLERFPVGWAAMVDCGLSQLGGPAMRPQHAKPSRIVPMRDKPPRVFRGTLETAAWLMLLAVAEQGPEPEPDQVVYYHQGREISEGEALALGARKAVAT